MSAPDPLLGLLRLARGRMQHILETATAAMTGAEVRMTRDVVAQIDAALSPKAGEQPPESPAQPEKCRWFERTDEASYLSLCDAVWAKGFDFALEKSLLDGKPCRKCGKPIELVPYAATPPGESAGEGKP